LIFAGNSSVVFTWAGRLPTWGMTDDMSAVLARRHCPKFDWNRLAECGQKAAVVHDRGRGPVRRSKIFRVLCAFVGLRWRRAAQTVLPRDRGSRREFWGELPVGSQGQSSQAVITEGGATCVSPGNRTGRASLQRHLPDQPARAARARRRVDRHAPARTTLIHQPQTRYLARRVEGD